MQGLKVFCTRRYLALLLHASAQTELEFT